LSRRPSAIVTLLPWKREGCTIAINPKAINSRWLDVTNNPTHHDSVLWMLSSTSMSLDSLVATKTQESSYSCGGCHHDDNEHPTLTKESSSSKWRMPKFHTVMTRTSVLCWMVAVATYALPLASGTTSFRVIPTISRLRHILALTSVGLGLPTLVRQTVMALVWHRRITASALMLVACLGAVALGQSTEAAAVASLFAVSEALEHRAVHVSTQTLRQVAEEMGPTTARLVVSDSSTTRYNHTNSRVRNESSHEQTILVPVHQLSVGSTVSVPVGEKVPCDGIILTGTTSFDVSSLTGESRPVQKQPNDNITAGRINVGPGTITVNTTAIVADSTMVRLAQLVKDSQSHKSVTERYIDQVARRYVPPVLGLALGMAIFPWIFLPANHPQVRHMWSRRALVTLVTCCPCPLVISTPVTYISGLAAAAKEGIIVKGGAVLEVRVHDCGMLWSLVAAHTIYIYIYIYMSL
jgi:cation transport ATPase